MLGYQLSSTHRANNEQRQMQAFEAFWTKFTSFKISSFTKSLLSHLSLVFHIWWRCLSRLHILRRLRLGRTIRDPCANIPLFVCSSFCSIQPFLNIKTLQYFFSFLFAFFETYSRRNGLGKNLVSPSLGSFCNAHHCKLYHLYMPITSSVINDFSEKKKTSG